MSAGIARDLLTLSDLVERTGVPASTIHHYRRTGAIPAPVSQSGNRFLYDETHVEALLRIRAHATADTPELRAKLVSAAIDAFKTRSYAEVSVSDIAEAAGMAKGNVYRYFDSKEALLTEAITTLLSDTTARLQESLDSVGGVDGIQHDPDKSALMLGYVVADVLPMLLELGARAAKGHEPSAELARNVLRTLARSAGRPFVAAEDRDDDAVTIAAGLRIIENAFATVMQWSVGTEWPPDNQLM